MTDIVERLRLQGKDFEESDKPYPEFISPNDAADEIERLRKELEETKRRLPTKSAIDICRELVKR